MNNNFLLQKFIDKSLSGFQRMCLYLPTKDKMIDRIRVYTFLLIIFILFFFNSCVIAQSKGRSRIQDSVRVSDYYEARQFRVYDDIQKAVTGILSATNQNLSFNNPWKSGHIDIALGGKVLRMGLHEDRSSVYLGTIGTELSLSGGKDLLFYAQDRGIVEGNFIPDMIIKENTNVGIGIWNPTEKLHVVGNMKTQGVLSVVNTDLLGNTTGVITAQAASDYTHMNFGTTSNHELTLEAYGKGIIRLHKEGYAVVHHRGLDIGMSISPANLDKYSLFVDQGVLSEDFALGPKNSWADYVFNKNYKRASLADVADYIKSNGHLPNMFTAQQIQTEGYSLHEMNVKLLEKVEELTLYAIEQQNELDKLKQELEKYQQLENKLKELEARINK
ncbi:hypothetical protein ACR777_02535 [Sphingobacterium spiritivorum]|uniref:hypothetical protein n=1 Tax=Sphingobacterium spiritivorum TaxID=258 RepID=UPI003DA2B630